MTRTLSFSGAFSNSVETTLQKDSKCWQMPTICRVFHGSVWGVVARTCHLDLLGTERLKVRCRAGDCPVTLTLSARGG